MTQHILPLPGIPLTIAYAILTFSFIADLYIYLRYYTGIARRARAVRRNRIPLSQEKPPVSVIVCARDEGESLDMFLPLLLEQDYPDFEVIVVNDGSWDNSEEILEKYRHLYPNLYYTNIPTETRVISHRKFAVTVGIKAARHDILLFTDACCHPLSSKWIECMVRNFTDTTEFVLGYGSYAPLRKSLLDRLIRHTTLLHSIRSLGYAYCGKPFTGSGKRKHYHR